MVPFILMSSLAKQCPLTEKATSPALNVGLRKVLIQTRASILPRLAGWLLCTMVGRSPSSARVTVCRSCMIAWAICVTDIEMHVCRTHAAALQKAKGSACGRLCSGHHARAYIIAVPLTREGIVWYTNVFAASQNKLHLAQ